jgi:predicted GNAT superfamily acetyltransferase
MKPLIIRAVNDAGETASITIRSYECLAKDYTPEQRQENLRNAIRAALTAFRLNGYRVTSPKRYRTNIQGE